MYQYDNVRASSPRTDCGTDVSSHSPIDPHLIEEVGMEELHVLPSNIHEEMCSSYSKSEDKYKSNN